MSWHQSSSASLEFVQGCDAKRPLTDALTRQRVSHQSFLQHAHIETRASAPMSATKSHQSSMDKLRSAAVAIVNNVSLGVAGDATFAQSSGNARQVILTIKAL
jgi:hypothetical protein